MNIFAAAKTTTPTPTVNDSTHLDSLRELVVHYERQGDFEQAYQYGLMYTRLRERIQQETLDRLVEQYEREYADNELENDRVNLLKQQALMELDQMEKEMETTRLRREQDSLALLNQRLDRQNQQTINDIAYKHMKQKEVKRQRESSLRKTRVAVLFALNGVGLVLLVLLIVYVRASLRHARLLRAEKQRAEEIMKQAQADNEAQSRFLLNLNREVRRPVDRIVEAARTVSRDDGTAKQPAVERMRGEIHELLTLVDDIIGRSCGQGEKKLMTLLAAVAIALTATWLCPARAEAQNNPYGIRNDFYEYFRRADLMVQDERVLAMTDTLYAWAKQAGDGLTMCLANDVRVGHAYFSRDPDKVRAALSRQEECVRATGHHKYLFTGWNRLILLYINQRNFVQATQETRRYQQEALRLNSTYGISRGYYYMGDIFMARGMLKEATNQYQQAVDYLLSHDDRTEISSAYARLGDAYVEWGDYDKAEYCLRQGASWARKEYEKINPNLGLLNLYVSSGQAEKARTVIPELLRLKGMGMLMGNRNYSFMNGMVKYYLLTGDKEKALLYLDSIGNRHPRTKYLTYAAVGDYERALAQMYKYNKEAANDDASLDAARLAALKADFDNHLKERANNELALRNALLRTEQLKAEQQLDIEQHRQDSLLISHNDLQEDAQEAAIILQRTEERTAWEQWQKQLVEDNFKRTMLYILAVLLLGVIVFLAWRLGAERRNARELQRQKEAAEEATRLAQEASLRKRDFMQQITHELRTPLNAVLGFSEVLCDEQMCCECAPEELADFRTRVSDGAESLVTLVDSSLELCAIEGGERKAEHKRIDLTALFAQLRKEFTPKLHEGVTLRMADPVPESIDSSSVAPLELNSDPALLTQALRLLLDNAVKFTQSGHVDVQCRMTTDTVEFSVEDTGCGIPPEKSEVIFQYFEKVDTFVPGIGLGLSLCRSLVRLLGGEVYLDTRYQAGSRFVLCLNKA
jgi:signal transduction histidine kinase